MQNQITMNQNVIHFYFDLSSPYAYLASEQIEALAERTGYNVDWHPIMLGFVFKLTGGGPLTSQPMKGEYSLRDFKRSAVFYDVPYRQPSTFPIATTTAARAILWAKKHANAEYIRLSKAFFQSFFQYDQDISKNEVVARILQASGFDADAVIAATQSDEGKALLKAEVDAALSNNVFGTPYFIVNGEPFWGADRLPMMERWLTKGAWSY
jgi:2-hydroxychromene-2-carboxylate isomerase